MQQLSSKSSSLSSQEAVSTPAIVQTRALSPRTSSENDSVEYVHSDISQQRSYDNMAYGLEENAQSPRPARAPCSTLLPRNSSGDSCGGCEHPVECNRCSYDNMVYAPEDCCEHQSPLLLSSAFSADAFLRLGSAGSQ